MLEVSKELVNYFVKRNERNEMVQWIKENIKEKDQEFFEKKIKKTIKAVDKETIDNLIIFHIYRLTFLTRGFLQQDVDFETNFVGFEVR